MKLLILPLCHFLHILGAVAWIGGILMILRVILPSSKAALESTATTGNLMKEVAQRFTPLANLSIFVLAGTGIVLFQQGRNAWNALISFKLLLAACMVMIHFYRGLILNPKIVKLTSQADGTQTARLKKFSGDLVKANFALGIMALMLTAVILSI
ncbi:MAG: hypothetical protein HZA20_06930 [Nitrospirae bacterium]|nr:hypothetical protein [Nitrospirota bacterium]